MGRTRRFILGLFFLGSTALLAGLLLFVHFVSNQAPTGDERAHGIVVLTGGELRIQAGLKLLAEGRGKRLLISGVNRANSRAVVLKRLGTPDNELLTCCIDIGYSAADTIGNAEETFEWVMNHRYTSLLVVTSNYHMPRSLVELSRVLPNVQFVPYPVISPNARLADWWRHPGTARLIMSEYVKLLAAISRLAISRLPDLSADASHRAPPHHPGDSPKDRTGQVRL
jgi:uncharacterized SAM-binding protein YcdF (DUF218 family)